jgi:hypothetical protein
MSFAGKIDKNRVISEDQNMNLKTPQSLKVEHEELHGELAKAINAGGSTGEAARVVAKALHPHFMKEEEYALPPLGLLPALALGIKGIYLGPIVPGWVNDDILKVLVEKYNVKMIGNPEEDIKAMMGN